MPRLERGGLRTKDGKPLNPPGTEAGGLVYKKEWTESVTDMEGGETRPPQARVKRSRIDFSV